MPKYEFDGRVALVTGAGTGIGRATALSFASNGARVVVGDIDRNSGEETVAKIVSSGGTAIFAQVDVADAAQVNAMVKAGFDAYGRLDFACNNAGLAVAAGMPLEISDSDYQRAIQVNVTGTWNCMRAELPPMLKQGHGAIVNLSSAAGLVGFANIAPYVAAKHAVIGLTKAFALAYAKQGVRINAICPGHTMTSAFEQAGPEVIAWAVGQCPMNRMGKPEEITAAVLWLSSDSASFVNGHSMSVDGGLVIQ